MTSNAQVTRPQHVSCRNSTPCGRMHRDKPPSAAAPTATNRDATRPSPPTPSELPPRANRARRPPRHVFFPPREQQFGQPTILRTAARARRQPPAIRRRSNRLPDRKKRVNRHGVPAARHCARTGDTACRHPGASSHASAGGPKRGTASNTPAADATGRDAGRAAVRDRPADWPGPPIMFPLASGGNSRQIVNLGKQISQRQRQLAGQELMDQRNRRPSVRHRRPPRQPRQPYAADGPTIPTRHRPAARPPSWQTTGPRHGRQGITQLPLRCRPYRRATAAKPRLPDDDPS